MGLKCVVGLLSDTESFEVKSQLKVLLENENEFKIFDLGVYRSDEEYDSQGLGDRAAFAIRDDICNCCILLSRTGNGLQMYANKHEFVRAVPCVAIDIAKLAIDEYEANMCDLPSFMSINSILAISKEFIHAFQKKTGGNT